MTRSHRSIAISWFLATVIGCVGQTQNEGQSRIHVAVSVAPQAWLVQEIGNGWVNVVSLARPGECPETFQPTDAQVSQIMQSKVYFRVGMPFEEQGAFRAIRATGRLRIVDTRQGIALRRMEGHIHGEKAVTSSSQTLSAEHPSADHGNDAEKHDGDDPHIWLSPRLLTIQARTVAETLGEIDPAHKPEFDRNLKAMESRLKELDESVRKALEPVRGRTFFVFHPAWSYFAEEYGLRQVAIEAEGKEPSDHDLTELQNEARREGAKVIFTSPQTARRSAEVVAAAIRGRVETLDPMDADVPANLSRAAKLLVESFQPGGTKP